MSGTRLLGARASRPQHATGTAGRQGGTNVPESRPLRPGTIVERFMARNGLTRGRITNQNPLRNP